MRFILFFQQLDRNINENNIYALYTCIASEQTNSDVNDSYIIFYYMYIYNLKYRGNWLVKIIIEVEEKKCN